MKTNYKNFSNNEPKKSKEPILETLSEETEIAESPEIEEPKVIKNAKVNAATGLRLRRTPVDGETIEVLKDGTVLEDVDLENAPEWLMVTTKDGFTGYVMSKYLKQI